MAAAAIRPGFSPPPPKLSSPDALRLAKAYFKAIADGLALVPADVAAASPSQPLTAFVYWAAPHLARTLRPESEGTFLPPEEALEKLVSPATNAAYQVLQHPEWGVLPLSELAPAGDAPRGMLQIADQQRKTYAAALPVARRHLAKAGEPLSLEPAHLGLLVPELPTRSFALNVSLLQDLLRYHEVGLPPVDVWRAKRTLDGPFPQLFLRPWIGSLPLGAFRAAAPLPSARPSLLAFQARIRPFFQGLARDWIPPVEELVTGAEKAYRAFERNLSPSELPSWGPHLRNWNLCTITVLTRIKEFSYCLKEDASSDKFYALNQRAQQLAHLFRVFVLRNDSSSPTVALNHFYRELADRRRTRLMEWSPSLTALLRAELLVDPDLLIEDPVSLFNQMQRALELKGLPEETPFDAKLRKEATQLRTALEKIDREWTAEICDSLEPLPMRLDFSYLFLEGVLWEVGKNPDLGPQTRRAFFENLLLRVEPALEECSLLSWRHIQKSYEDRIAAQLSRREFPDRFVGSSIIGFWSSLESRATALRGASELAGFIGKLVERSPAE